MTVPVPGSTADQSVPAAAADVFGARTCLAQRYAALLADDGVAHGHIGPREVPRLWERHLLNSALVTDLLPAGEPAAVVDVGSGAGLPGLPMAIRRPDLSVVLLEPMARRVRFLEATVEALDLDAQVSVVRARADDPSARQTVGSTDWVVARAVAPLDRLVRWCLPLLSRDGTLLAMKGRSAPDEVGEHRAAVERLGGTVAGIRQVGGGDAGIDPTWVVEVRRTEPARRTRRRGGRSER